MNALLTSEEIALARHCLSYAKEKGADAVRITLTKSLMTLVGVLNGEVDKTSLALDRSLQLQLFVKGRFGTFSSNRLEKEQLEAFVREAIATTEMLEPDTFRRLPAPERLAQDALTGRELDLYDEAIESITAESRREMALRSSCHSERQRRISLVAEEGELSDTVFDILTLDSQGLFARHSETSFEIGYESTVEDTDGRHYSSYWWDSTPRFKDLQWQECARTAYERALAQTGPKSVPSGKYTAIIDSECAAKLLTPVLNALGGYSLQQHNSFLENSLGEKRFPDGLTVLDLPRTKGDTGCRLFDTEGVACKERAIIENGVVKTCFLNTYIAAKMGLEPTAEDSTRVKVLPYGGCKTREDVLQKVQDGILVTGFNGGNSNPATGNFSYGIEGFRIEGGKITHPVREMLITGDFLSLWNSLIAAASDARPCLPKLVPTLAFSNVDFSA